MIGDPPSAITERSIIPLKGGIDAWKEPYKQYLLIIKEQPGFLRTRWGPRNEDLNVIDLLTGWASPEDRDMFYKSPAYARARAAMRPVLDGIIVRFSLQFWPYAPKLVIESPICQIITIRNCTGDEQKMRRIFENGYNLPGARTGACGFAHAGIEGYGQIFMALIGWESIEAAQKADRSSYIPTGVGDVEVNHNNFLYPVKGYSITNYR